jgi:hypothetical protein
MPRALAAFQKVGLSVTPAATDIHAGPFLVPGFLDLLPDVKALAGTNVELTVAVASRHWGHCIQLS